MTAGGASHGAWLMAALLGLVGLSIWLGRRAQRSAEKGDFMKGYFIGHRNLGPWALGLTAMVQSAGTFMGFPALVYSHGWSLAFWLSGHMVIPLAVFAFLGRRLAQVSRRAGAITVPDLLRERFGARSVGWTASLLVVFFTVFALIGQFKAGALLMKAAWPAADPAGAAAVLAGRGEPSYLAGLGVFFVVVVGYTLVGGFLAAVWTDLLQSVLMLLGVLLLFVLTATAAGGGLEEATARAVAATGPGFAFCPGYSSDGRAFVSIGWAVSMSFLFFFANAGGPGGAARIMAARDLRSLRGAMVILAVYNMLIYVPLILICVFGRSLIPDLPASRSDEIIPRLALLTTAGLPGGSILAGLVLIAPLGAAMATVSTYLVVVASGVVRDVYQRLINPSAPPGRIRLLSYGCVLSVGGVALAANLWPVDYIQAVILFSAAGIGASFCVPLIMALYWRRATAAGAVASMAAGALTVLGLFVAGWLGEDPGIGPATRFRPHYLLGLDPFVWGLAASAVVGVAVSRATRPPPGEVVARLFGSEVA